MKKNLLSILILVLLIVNIALTSVMMISVISTNKKTAELVISIAMAMHMELYTPGGEAATEVPISETETYVMAEMMIPLAFSTVVGEDGSITTSSKQNYIMFTPSILQNTKHEDYKDLGGAEKMAAVDSVIQDVINSVVGQHTLEDCQSDFESIREEILKEVQSLFDSSFVYKIAITGVKYG